MGFGELWMVRTNIYGLYIRELYAPSYNSFAFHLPSIVSQLEVFIDRQVYPVPTRASIHVIGHRYTDRAEDLQLIHSWVSSDLYSCPPI